MTNEATPSIAGSVDGTTFRFRGDLAAGLRLGGFVSLTTDHGTRLGQVLSQEVVDEPGERFLTGSGRILGREPGSAPFVDAEVSPAPDDPIGELLGDVPAAVRLGTLQHATGLPAWLDARGFNRHTFLCGQSGSGKTYSLGLLLEQLVLHTRLPLLVLDPNGDHIHLGRAREDVDPSTAEAYRAAAEGVRVLQAAADGDAEPLRIRFSELGIAGTAAILQLDPITDREEYNAVLHVLDADPVGHFHSVAEAFEAFAGSGNPALDAVRMRARTSVWTAWGRGLVR